MGIILLYIHNMAARPLNRRKITKKITKIPGRFQADEYKRVNPNSHRAIRGIDCSTRRRFRGRQPEKMFIGHKQDAKTRHVLPNGFKKLLIANPEDIELLLMNNRVFCGEIAQNISTNKRLRIVQRARELNVRLTNANAKAKKESTE